MSTSQRVHNYQIATADQEENIEEAEASNDNSNENDYDYDDGNFLLATLHNSIG